MRLPLKQKLVIPEGVSCCYENKILSCKKDSTELKKVLDYPEVEVKISNNEIEVGCKKGNKNHHKVIMTFKAHINNVFTGLQEKFVYELESVNVHFPMALKADSVKLTINNFLGEKVPRVAKILPNVEVEIKGQKITISSHDKEAAGQTAANFEKATVVKGRDKRIFQDGIYIVTKPERKNV